MRSLHDLSIRGKLMAVILLTSAAGMLLMGMALLTYDWFVLRRLIQNNTTALADVVAENSTATLVYKNATEAEEGLRSLAAQPQILGAALYDDQGQLFASYVQPGAEVELPAVAQPVGGRYARGQYHLFRPVVQDGKRMGTIYVDRSLAERTQQVRLYLAFLFVILGAGLLLVAMLSANLQRLISLPILSLANTARTVSAQRDYSVRAQKFSNDELGGLTDSFNQMLGAIQARDQTLHHAYETMLREVTERKRAEEALRLDETRLETLLKLNQMTEAPLDDLTSFTLEEGVRLTRSKMGYLAFMNADETVLTMHAWSKSAMEICQVAGVPREYKVAETGLWGEAVRQRQPVITNDYESPSVPKKGTPAGHVPVKRHMNVPVFDGERIVAVAGVGNKDEPYDDADVRQLTLLMQGMWRLIQRRRAEEELRRHRDNLEELVNERTAELQQANTSLTREIETRKRAEEMLLRQAEELQRQAELLQLTHDAIFVRDLDDKIFFWNRGAEECFGWRQDDALQKPAQVLLNTEFPKPRAQVIDELMQRGRWEGELVQTRRDGTRLVVASRCALLRDYDGKPTGILEINTDITQRKRAEEAMRRERDRAQTYLDVVGVMVVVLNPDGTVALINRQGCQLLGYTEQELVGRRWFDIALPSAVRQNVQEAFLSLLHGGQPFPEHYENLVQTKSGEHRLISWHNILLRNRHGKVTGIISAGNDITDQRRAEKRLRETAAALARSNKELEQFAYVASHDLREPLRMVASYVQLLQRRYQGKFDADADQFIGFIVDGARRMQALIDDLLQYARIETRGKPPQPVDLNRILEVARENLQVAIEEAEAEVVLPAQLPTVPGDDTQMTQLFQNLLSNAVKFHQPDATPRVEISVTRRPGEWEFAVRDNGIGIDPQYHERIFVIFQRLHGREQYPGTGIGLALCKKIVERHGGRIWVESQIGQGATFRFTLPAAAA